MTYIITVKQITDWILENRKGDAFKDYPPNKIACAIDQTLNSTLGVFSYHVSDEGKLDGVVIGEKIAHDVIMIHDILCLNHSVLILFLRRFIELYPGYKLCGKAHGRNRVFLDPHKLLKKL